MELNLSPFKYRNIFSKDGGPIDRLNVSLLEQPGKTQEFEAVAFLLPDIVPQWHKNSTIYCGGHGGGTHHMRNIACYIAMSEALERWAYFGPSFGEQQILFGFDVEPSTSGMAAFPGLTKRPARVRANWEAVERWSLLEWWYGRLPAVLSPGSGRAAGALYISQPLKDCCAVIIWATLASGSMAYGFAAADTPETALHKASIEKARNTTALTRFFNKELFLSQDFIADGQYPIYDRRLIFFASPPGGDMFWDRAISSSDLNITPVIPPKLIDTEIKGPWSKYAT
ncbi:MAG: hypothetical protein AAB359_05730, partial [Elusimicrobiota bacterium]